VDKKKLIKVRDDQDKLATLRRECLGWYLYKFDDSYNRQYPHRIEMYTSTSNIITFLLFKSKQNAEGAISWLDKELESEF
jgi:hypothetical protein